MDMEGGIWLELTSTYPLAVDVADESAEMRMQRLINENPVVIFSRSSSCCMCHVMKRLLSTLGVHPTVIQLDDDEISALPQPDHDGGGVDAPAVFIGGTLVGGLDNLFALHLSGLLVPKLAQVGALNLGITINYAT